MTPEKRNGTATNGPAAEPRPHHKASTAHYIRGLRHRRAATYRLPRLDCGHADPWTCRHDNGELTTDSAIAAAEHLLHNGLTPAFTTEAARALWRVGRRDYATMCVHQVSP